MKPIMLSMYARRVLFWPIRGALLVLLVSMALGCSQPVAHSGPPIIVAADARTEQQLLAQLTAIYLRDQGYEVQLRAGLHAEWMVRRAMEAGNIGLAWQETGRVWHQYLNHDQPVTNESELLRRVRDEDKLDGIIWLSPCDWSARMGLVVSNDLAATHRLASIADLAQHISRSDPDLALCVPGELYDSPWGVRGLERVYGFRFKAGLVQHMDLDQAYAGLLNGQCAVALGYGKDIAAYAGKLVALRDSRAFFSASSLAPTLHTSVLKAYPELERVLATLTAKLGAGTLAELERQIASGQISAERAARQFLRDAGLLRGR